MLSDKRKRWLIKNHAWEIYLFLQELPEPEDDLIPSLYEQIELAAFSGVFLLHAPWRSLNQKLVIREQYEFPIDQLHIESYSYALVEIGGRAIIRADSAPHHERDYRGKLLQNFPHHLHDESGRLCSFSGKLEDFISLAISYLPRK